VGKERNGGRGEDVEIKSEVVASLKRTWMFMEPLINFVSFIQLLITAVNYFHSQCRLVRSGAQSIPHELAL
jgi:hypothetical protein